MRERPIHKPGPGWKRLADDGTVYEHTTGLRVHVYGLATLPTGRIVYGPEWPESKRFWHCVRMCGCNQPRGAMVWAMHLLASLCDHCGACCFEQGSPPGYIAMIVGGREYATQWLTTEDIARYESMPAEARETLERYMAQQRAGEVDPDGPCCWLDPETNRCRWYEWRPSICRDLSPGSEGCLAWRDEYNIDIEEITVCHKAT